MTVSGMKVQSCMERLHQRNEELVFHVHISYYKCLQIIITLYELYLHIVFSCVWAHLVGGGRDLRRQLLTQLKLLGDNPQIKRRLTNNSIFESI